MKNLLTLTFCLIIICGLFFPSYVAVYSKENYNNDKIDISEKNKLKNIDNQFFWGWWWPEKPGRYEPFFNVNEIVEVESSAYGATSADFNNDGLIDFGIAWSNLIRDDDFHSYISIFYKDETSTTYIRNDVFSFDYTRINDLDAADFDGDGDIDLLYTYSEYEIDSGKRTNGVGKFLFNDGNGVFSDEKIAFYHILSNEVKKINPQISSADFDGDGDIDFIVGDNSGLVSFYKNEGMGSFNHSSDSIFNENEYNSWGIANADFDSDGDIDFIVTEKTESEDGNIYLKYNDGTDSCFNHSNFTTVANLPAILYETFYSSAFPIADGCLCSIDYNSDGLMDFVYGGPGNLFLYIQQENAIFEPFTVARFPEYKSDGGRYDCNNLRQGGITVNDFNDDGLDDIIVGGSHGEIRLFTNNHILIDIILPDRSCKIINNEITTWLLPFYPLLKHGTSIVQGDVTVITKELEPLSRVDFYLDDKLVYTDEDSPFEWEWNRFSFGRHKVKAVAYDLKGDQAGFDDTVVWKFL